MTCLRSFWVSKTLLFHTVPTGYHGEVQTNPKPQQWQEEEHCKDLEDKAQDQRPGSDPLRHEA